MKIIEFYKKVFLTEILQAHKLTFRHMFVKPVTLQYPRQKLSLPDTHRGALCLLRYEDGAERCVGCNLCEAACPSRCIRVVSEENKNVPLQRYASEFYIDITKCVFCGYCVEACPVNALAMTKMYAYSTDNRRDLIFDKAKLYEIGDNLMSEAKSYLVAHRQEKDDEESRHYRYKFPLPVLGRKE